MAEVSLTTVARTTFGALSFVAGFDDCEEKTVDLKIANVVEFLAMSNEGLLENGLTFEAGLCNLNDGTRARPLWKYYFKHTQENGVDWVGGYLWLYSDRSKVKSAKASHSLSLASGVNPIPITSYTMECKEFVQFAPTYIGSGQPKLIKKSELLEKTRETNTLEVNLLLKVFSNQGFKPVLQESTSTSLDAIQMRGQMNSDLKKMLQSGDGGDVDIQVPNEARGEVDETSYTRKVHKNILIARSSVFSKMFAKGSEMVEAKTGKVVIEDLSPRGLDIFLHYIYTGEVLEDFAQVLPEILNAADKYDCGKLKNFCGHKLLAGLTTANALKMYKLAKLHSLSFAAKGVMEFIHKNTKVVFTEGVIDKVADAEDSE